MIAADTSGLLYSHLFDRNLKELIEIGIDLKPLFKSTLVYHRI